METLNNVIGKLYTYFDLLNTHYYDDELVQPIITVQKDFNSKKNQQTLGWCSVEKVWNDGKDKTREINICAESLSRPIEDVVGTLLHEMAHLFNLQQGIKDTSGASNQYHNDKFKKTSESHGLTVEKDRYGWHITHPNASTIEFLKSIDAKPFEIFRERQFKIEKPKKTRESHTYVCPSCEAKVKSSTEVRVMCKDCEEDMEEE